MQYNITMAGAKRSKYDGVREYGMPPTRSTPHIDTHAARYKTWRVAGEYGSRVTATKVGNRPVQDNADTGAVPVSRGPTPTAPDAKVKDEICENDVKVKEKIRKNDVKMKEEIPTKDEVSPATSESGVDVHVQDEVDESHVAKDDCLRDPRKATTASPSEEKCDEPKKWGGYPKKTGSE